MSCELEWEAGDEQALKPELMSMPVRVPVAQQQGRYRIGENNRATCINTRRSAVALRYSVRSISSDSAKSLSSIASTSLAKPRSTVSTMISKFNRNERL